MKRFIVGLAVAAILTMPMAASALEKMDNSQLRSATGQAGVSIAVDGIVIYQKSLADSTFWDTDGVNGMTGAAGIMIDQAEEMQKLITINAILNADIYGVDALRATFGNTEDIGIIESAGVAAAIAGGTLDPTNGQMAGTTTGISPLTIDVGTCKALTAGWNYNTTGMDAATLPASALAVGGVVIGLPTVEIKTYSTVDFKTIKLRNGTWDAAAGIVTDSYGTADQEHFNANHALITIEKSGTSTMAILGGTLEIAPH
ncbi:MAG: hypothetical protein RBR53_01150 [Desulforegulaceae bacterium]|nr:hypothetical protein [Desulforegulaceae bacterium]